MLFRSVSQSRYPIFLLLGIFMLLALDLIDDSCLYVSAPIDEVDVAFVKEGLPGRITLDVIKG